MALDREAVWAALFSKLQSSLASNFTTISRTHVRPPALAAESQPALFLVQQRESRNPRPSGTGGKIELTGFLIVYFIAPEPLAESIGAETATGATTLNGLLSVIDDALKPDNIVVGRNTLGGTVHHCWIEGDTDMDTGIHTAQGAAIIPVKILAPA